MTPTRGDLLALLEHLRRHPFIRFDEERVRTRAYFHHLNGTCESALKDWLVAELEELLSAQADDLMRLQEGFSFEKAYEPALSHVVEIGVASPRVRLGGRGSCAMCGAAGSRSFRTDAHLIGEAFGNRTLFILDECDDCNQASGRDLEQHLGSMLLGDRVLGQLKRKHGGTAKAKLGDDRSSYIGGGPAGTLRINSHAGDDSVVFAALGNNRASLTFPPVKYRAGSALRAVGRMAYLALDVEDRARVPMLRDWVRGVTPIEQPSMFWQFFYPQPFPTTGITTWLRRSQETNLPPVMLMFHAAHSLLLVAPHTSLADRVSLPPLPKPSRDATELTGTCAEVVRNEVTTERTTYNLFGTDHAYLFMTSAPSEVRVRVGSHSFVGSLRVNSKGTSEVQYQIDGGDMPGTMTLQTRDEGRTWECKLIGVDPRILWLVEPLGSDVPVIEDLEGREIFPRPRGWFDPAPL